MLLRRLLATASFRSRGATLDRELCWHLCKKTSGEEKDMETNETLAASVAAIGNFSQPSDLPTQILLNHPNNTEFMVHSVVTVVSLSIVYGLLSLTAFVGNMLVIWVICKFHIFLQGFPSNTVLTTDKKMWFWIKSKNRMCSTQQSWKTFFKRPEANLLSFFHILSVLSVYVKLFFRDLESLSESSTKMRLVPFLNGNVINLLSLDYVTTYEKFSTFPQLFHLFLWREKLGFSELSNPLQRHDDIVAFMGFQTIECSCQ